MPGDVGLVAKLLSEILEFSIDPDGYARLDRDNKLKFIMRGINAGIKKDDWTRVDLLFAHYRELLHAIGP